MITDAPARPSRDAGEPPAHATRRRSNRIAWLVVLALVVGFVAIEGAYVVWLAHHHPEIVTEGDTPSYLTPAFSLLHHHTFLGPNGEPEFLRTPGYPLFIAIAFKVLGQHITSVLLAQVAVGALTIVVAYAFAARVWSPPVGVLAAALVTFEPLQHYTTGTLVSERLATLCTLLVAATGWAMFTRLRDPARAGAPWVAALGCGAALAAATMVRPVTYYLPVFVLALVAWQFVRDRTTRVHAVRAAVAFAVPLVVVIGGWQVRNHHEVDSWRFSGIEAKNIYSFRAAAVVAEQEHIPFDTARRVLHTRLPRRAGEEQGPYYARMYRKGMHIVTSHPVITLRNTTKGLFHEVVETRYKTFNYARLVGRDEYARGAIVVFTTGVLFALYGLAAFGFAGGVRVARRRIADVFVLGLGCYILVVSAGPEADAGRAERFRAPVMPLVCCYAAAGAVALWQRRRASPTPPVVMDSAA